MDQLVVRDLTVRPIMVTKVRLAALRPCGNFAKSNCEPTTATGPGCPTGSESPSSVRAKPSSADQCPKPLRRSARDDLECEILPETVRPQSCPLRHLPLKTISPLPVVGGNLLLFSEVIEERLNTDLRARLAGNALGGPLLSKADDCHDLEFRSKCLL